MALRNASDPQPRPLRWWSDTALAALADRIDTAWQGWAARWDVAVDPARVHAAQDTPAGVPLAWQPWQADGAAAAAWAWTGDTGESPTATLAFALFGTAGGPASAAVAQQAWSALADDLVRVFGRSDVSPEAGFGLPPASAWSGSVRVCLPWRGGAARPLWLSVAGDAVAPLLSAHRRPWTGRMPPISESVTAAIAERPFSLSVELDGTELDLGTLQSLRVGDVLRLSHRLDAPLTVRASDPTADPVCAGYLGARDGHRAIELVRPSGL